MLSSTLVDGFGFDKIERSECPKAAHLLYKVIDSRTQKRSTALITNVDFEKWSDYFLTVRSPWQYSIDTSGEPSS
jgi:hypothetical protein